MPKPQVLEPARGHGKEARAPAAAALDRDFGAGDQAGVVEAAEPVASGALAGRLHEELGEQHGGGEPQPRDHFERVGIALRELEVLHRRPPRGIAVAGEDLCRRTPATPLGVAAALLLAGPRRLALRQP